MRIFRCICLGGAFACLNGFLQFELWSSDWWRLLLGCLAVFYALVPEDKNET